MSFLNTLKNSQPNSVFIHKLNKFQTPRIPWKKSYRPSDAYNFCPRLWALLALGHVKGYKKFDPRTKRVVDNGSKVHERYADYTHKLDVVYKDKRYGDPENEYRCEERLLEHPLGIRGKYDAIIEGDDGVLYVTDFKSIKHEDFAMLTSPLDYHVFQLVIYLGMVNELYDLDKPISGLYVYESKNTQDVKEFKVPWDEINQGLYEEYLGYIRGIETAIETGDVNGLPCFCKKKNKCKDWDIEQLSRTNITVAM